MKEYFAVLIVAMIISLFLGLFKEKNNVIRLLFSSLISLPLVVLAGIRTIDIGTDMLVYGVPNFNTAQMYSSYFDYIKDVSSFGGTEVGYATINYVVSMYTSNVNILMFVVSLLTVVPFVYAAFKYKNDLNISVSFQILIFFCLFYGSSLNLMRQSIAISFVYLSMSFFLLEKSKKNFLKGIVFLLLAIFFHRSSIIMIPIILIFCLDWKENGLLKNIFKVIFILGVGLVLTSQLIDDSSSYILKYSRYVGIGGTSIQAEGGQSIIKALSSSLIPIGLVLLIGLKNPVKDYFLNRYGNRINLSKGFIVCVLLADILLQFVSASNVVVGRVGLFFKIFEVVFIPLVIKTTIPKRVQGAVTIAVCGYLLLSFYVYTISGFNSIYPYQSVLGI